MKVALYELKNTTRLKTCNTCISRLTFQTIAWRALRRVGDREMLGGELITAAQSVQFAVVQALLLANLCLYRVK